MSSEPHPLTTSQYDSPIYASTYAGPKRADGRSRARLQLAQGPEPGCDWITTSLSVEQAEHLAAYITDWLRDLNA